MPITTAQGRINILIGRPVNEMLVAPASPNEPSTRFTGVPVYVRDGYSAVSADRADGRPVAASVHCRERWDANAVNNDGRLGAFVVDVPPGSVEAAVKLLRDAWGAAIPVQDNSGRYAHLATVNMRTLPRVWAEQEG